ncbi:MAG: DUF2336 domain-containing protein [Phyllobacterium sp.]
MIVQHFLKWIDHAPVAQRVLAAYALARAYMHSTMEFDERCAAEAALTLLLDDPSPKVRAALADAFSSSAAAPLHIVAALACESVSISGPILTCSPLLLDMDLVDRVATGDLAMQKAIAQRSAISTVLSAAFAEIAEPEACIDLLYNRGARIASVSYRRLVERLGHLPDVREALLDDESLPSDCRHELAVCVGEALAHSDLVTAMLGSRRVECIVRDACIKASLMLVDRTDQSEYPALIEHLLLRGDLTTAFVIRVTAFGKLEFLAAILASLSGQTVHRVNALLDSGRDTALFALFRGAGLPESVHQTLLVAVFAWRKVGSAKLMVGPQEIARMMMNSIPPEAADGGHRSANDDLITLLRGIYLETIRENARNHALDVAATPASNPSKGILLEASAVAAAA